jgi:cytochrome c-type biogenesis protein CcmE
MSKGVQIAVATLTVFVALGWMIASSEGTFQYFAHVSEIRDGDRGQAAGLRVHGYVVDGSITRDVQSASVEFSIQDRAAPDASAVPVSNRAAIAVRYDGIDVPDLFRDGAEVVVEGGFVEGRFVASKIMAKCPSKYEVAPAVPERKA